MPLTILTQTQLSPQFWRSLEVVSVFWVVWNKLPHSGSSAKHAAIWMIWLASGDRLAVTGHFLPVLPVLPGLPGLRQNADAGGSSRCHLADDLYCKPPFKPIALPLSHAKHKPNRYLLWQYVGVNGHTVGSTTELKAISWASQHAIH